LTQHWYWKQMLAAFEACGHRCLFEILWGYSRAPPWFRTGYRASHARWHRIWRAWHCTNGMPSRSACVLDGSQTLLVAQSVEADLASEEGAVRQSVSWWITLTLKTSIGRRSHRSGGLIIEEAGEEAEERCGAEAASVAKSLSEWSLFSGWQVSPFFSELVNSDSNHWQRLPIVFDDALACLCILQGSYLIPLFGMRRPPVHISIITQHIDACWAEFSIVAFFLEGRLDGDGSTSSVNAESSRGPSLVAASFGAEVRSSDFAFNGHLTLIYL